MKLLQDLRREGPQLRILGAVQMRLEPPLGDAPFLPPHDEAHLLDADLAEQALAVDVEVRGRGEEAVGLDAAVEELAEEAHDSYRGADEFGGHDGEEEVKVRAGRLVAG